MKTLCDIEYTEDGINKQETGLTYTEAVNRRAKLETENAGDIRIIER